MLTSRFPGEVSGADLPTLTNPAGAGDMASGKQAIGQDGGVVTGSLETQSALAVLADTVSAGTVQGQPATQCPALWATTVSCEMVLL